MQSQGNVGWIERKDPRIKVVVRVRMRAGAMPSDACIRDVSSRGLLVQAGAPPVRGTLIELVGPFAPIVGRVVWTKGHRFGVQTQDRINVSALISGKLDRRKTDLDGAFQRRAADLERRKDPLASKSWARWLQYGAVLLIGGAIATLAAQASYHQLSRMATAVEAGLG